VSHTDEDSVPGWLRDLAAAASKMEINPMAQPPAHGGRASAVLVLFAGRPGNEPDPDLLFIQRSADLRLHAGQPAFPGGAIDAADGGPVAAALREAAEEARVDPAGVEVLAVLPELFIVRSGFTVTPVLAWWRDPAPVEPGDPAEITAVARIRIAELADPANRLMVRYPTGPGGPAFRVRGMLVWGFTAMVVDRLLAIGGWERPWDAGSVEDLPADVLRAATGGERSP
jgi:8-oxo-dGTP pyrophosphatase MutT (NUDIX family)